MKNLFLMLAMLFVTACASAQTQDSVEVYTDSIVIDSDSVVVLHPKKPDSISLKRVSNCETWVTVKGTVKNAALVVVFFNGSLIQSEFFPMVPGKNVLPVKLCKLNPGVYQVNLYLDSEIRTLYIRRLR